MFPILGGVLAQRSFEELGTPLAGVTFCVVDLETTGASPKESTITEIGALKVKRGEVIGSFQSLVDPGVPVPAFIRLLTGISDQMLIEAPPIEAVLPNFLEFLGGSVLVAHNARFDVGFLNAALTEFEYPVLQNRIVDTASLARRILAGEVRNNKLETLANHLRCAHKPCHRAYADVLATTDVLHHLIERVAGFGVTTLEDLLSMSSARIDGTFSKITLADGLPGGPGVYRFLDEGGRTLYVGKASDLRSRVRSYFYGDPRSSIRNLLREVQAISYEEHHCVLEAEVAEARAIALEIPPYNRRGKRASSSYLKIDIRRRQPRVATARKPKEDGALYLGPYRSGRTVGTLIDALRTALPLHRCTDPGKCSGCAFQDAGTCSGTIGQRAQIARIAHALIAAPGPLLQRIARKMHALAKAERFEEAAEVRERGILLQGSLEGAIRLRSLVDAGDLIFAEGDRALLIRSGQLAAAAPLQNDDLTGTIERLRAAALATPVGSFIPPEVHAEARVVDSWLERSTDLTLLHASGPWVWPAAAKPSELFKKRVRR